MNPYIDQEAKENAVKAEKEVEAFKGHLLKHAGSGTLHISNQLIELYTRPRVTSICE